MICGLFSWKCFFAAASAHCAEVLCCPRLLSFWHKACLTQAVTLSLSYGMLQLCRASGHHEAAGTAALEALARGVPGAGLERARLLWARDQQHGAVVRLQEARTPPLSALLQTPRWPQLWARDQQHGAAVRVQQARISP